jgi:hypothetical protein
MSTAHNTGKRAADKDDNEHFFHHTRDRFLWDEPRQLSQRYIQFNINELASLAVRAAEAVGNGPRTCVDIEKLPDGMHSNAVRFTMDDGFQAVGKVPNLECRFAAFHNCLQMRNVLGTPVPKDFSWSSTIDNAVGAEYILMENVRGVQLSQIWNRLDVKPQFDVVRKVASYQDSWAQTRFSQYGSLYYKKDLGHLTMTLQHTDRDGQHVVDDRFAVSPSISRQSIDDGRAQFDFDRGQCRYHGITSDAQSHFLQGIPRKTMNGLSAFENHIGSETHHNFQDLLLLSIILGRTDY